MGHQSCFFDVQNFLLNLLDCAFLGFVRRFEIGLPHRFYDDLAPASLKFNDAIRSKRPQGGPESGLNLGVVVDLDEK